MVERLTDDEMQRIKAFAATPAYARTPEQLLPADADAIDSDEETDEHRLASAFQNSPQH